MASEIVNSTIRRTDEPYEKAAYQILIDDPRRPTSSILVTFLELRGGHRKPSKS
jgi:hypothetical protein